MENNDTSKSFKNNRDSVMSATLLNRLFFKITLCEHLRSGENSYYTFDTLFCYCSMVSFIILCQECDLVSFATLLIESHAVLTPTEWYFCVILIRWSHPEKDILARKPACYVMCRLPIMPSALQTGILAFEQRTSRIVPLLSSPDNQAPGQFFTSPQSILNELRPKKAPEVLDLVYIWCLLWSFHCHTWFNCVSRWSQAFPHKCCI